MKAGSLRHRITIYSLTTGSSAAGSAAQYTTVFAAGVPAAIEPSRATDLIRNGQTISEVMIPITIRYMPGVQASMRIKFNNNSTFPTYVIQGIINTKERNVELVLMCLALGASQ